MTIKDDEKFCIPCKKIGLEHRAHRIMPGGGGRCDEHFRDEQGLPQLNDEAKRFIELCKEREKNPTGAPPAQHALPDPEDDLKKRKKLDYPAMQADRDAGMRIADVAKKYGCSYASVAMNTHLRKDPTPAVKTRKAKPHADDALFRRTAESNGFASTIADLKAKRAVHEQKIAAIDQVIAGLEKLA